MKLLIDENISPEVTEGLRAIGLDAKSVRECCRGYDDDRIAGIAVSEERVLVTFDMDFGEIYRSMGASSIILRLRTRKPALVLKHLLDFLRIADQNKINFENKLVVVTEGRVRTVG